MTIQLQNFSSKTIYVQDVLFIVKGFTMKLFLQIFLNSIIYETFPVRNFLRIQYANCKHLANINTFIYYKYSTELEALSGGQFKYFNVWYN